MNIARFLLPALIAWTLFAQDPASRQAVSISLAASKWQKFGCVDFTTGNCDYGLGPKLSNDSTGDLAFQFPAPNASMNYLYTAHTTSIAGYKSVAMIVSASTLTGAPFFDWRTNPDNNCTGPIPAIYAHARPFLEERNDQGGEFQRWWANGSETGDDTVAYELDKEGTMTVTVPLTPNKWSSVYGQFGDANPAATRGFNNTLSHIGNVGMTFGGGCFFGHGVFVTGGTAQFRVLSYKFQ